MGCDIHSFVERREDGRWVRLTGDLFPDNDQWSEPDEPFPNRNYDLFGFLADVRNYSHCPVIAEPRGLPDDVSSEIRAEHEDWGRDAHSTSWLTVAEMADFPYDQTFENRRTTRTTVMPWGTTIVNGVALAEEGEGDHVTVRDFLGEWYFERLAELVKLGNQTDVRITYWFDN